MAKEAKEEDETKELTELFDLMEKSSKLESGETPESIHRKHLRFTMEKEFIELLASPQYLHYLSQEGYFEDEKFIKYLEYLQYWKEAKYAKCIEHVHCLRFLELLQLKDFRKKCRDMGFIEMLHGNQFWYWKEHKNREFYANTKNNK